MNTRGVIASMLAAMLLLGSAPAVSVAQQPPPPPPPPPVLMPDVVKEEDRPTMRPFDLYSVGAGVFTVARIPLNVGLCALGTVVGSGLFLATLGSAYRTSTRVFEEGCAQKWLVRSDDLRPVRASAGIFESRMERYQER
jgi:hypothetical protein